MVVKEMTRNTRTQTLSTLTFAIVVIASIFSANSAQAATKSINCYKGTTMKVVKAASPKCPTGWTTTKPVVAKTPNAPAPAAGSKTLTLNATYTGKIAMVWSDSDVQATNVTATGTGTTLGLTQLTGTGSSSPASQCSTISGTGTVSDGTNTLKANFDPAAQGCAKDGAAPTTVTINGNMIITGGTGKYSGATGTLKFTGSFPVNSTAAGTNESGALTLNVSGSFTTK